LNQAEKDEHAGKLAEKPWNVRLDRQRFKIDDAQKKLVVEHAKL